MKKPDIISAEELSKMNKEASLWIQFTQELRTQIKDFSVEIERAKDQSKLSHTLLSEILMAQFFTFSSIQLLVSNRHSADAFSLLRTIYEGQIHIWNMCRGTDNDIKRYCSLATIQEWRIAQESLKIDPETIKRLYYSDKKLEKLKREYEAVLPEFNCRPGKLPRNYQTTPISEIAKQIDIEEGEGPLMQWMNLRLYSSGSEYIHRSFFGIREGHALVEFDGNWVLAPNLFRSIEAAWWSSTIILNSIKWIAVHFKVNFPQSLIEKQNEVHTRSASSMKKLSRVQNR